MSDPTFAVVGMAELFPQEGGWVYVRVPQEHTEATDGLAERGLVAIRATVGSTAWDTSLMPMGDGTHFIALNRRVRDAEGIDVGDPVELTFVLRERD